MHSCNMLVIFALAMLFLPLVIFALYTFKLFCPSKISPEWLCLYSKTIKMKNLPFLKFTHTWGRECMEQYACDLRINVNKYIFMIMIFCCLCIHWKKREEMLHQYEAHKVHFYYAYVIGYMTSPCCNEWNRPLAPTLKYKGILGLKYQCIFIFIFNKFRFNLYLLCKSYSLFQNM